MARVHTVENNRNAFVCGRCRTEIPPGAGYRYAQPGFRNRNKLIRCMLASCRFRQSELTSGKMSAVYSATESAEDAIIGWDGEDSEDVAQALRDCADEVREVAQEYSDAAEAMNSAGEAMQEKADNLESFADELESAADNLPDKPGEEDKDGELETPADVKKAKEVEKKKGERMEEKGTDKEEDPESLDNWRQEVRDAASDALGTLSE